MSKTFCCTICLSINKRTINVYDTDLQYVYENLASLKVKDDECWMCYICHMRLQQCHQLQKLAIHTRGLIDDIFQNKIDIKFGMFGSLLEISTSKTKIFSTMCRSHIQEPDDKTEFYYCDLQDKILDNVNRTKSTTPTTTSIKIKQEIAVKTEICSDNEMEQDECNKQEPLNITNQSQSNIDKNLYQHPSDSAIEICLEDWEEQSMNNSAIERQIEIEIEDISKDEQLNMKDCKTNASETQPARTKKLFSCDVCSKKFSWESDLRSHIRMHTGEKPFSCNLCPSKFTRKSSLNIHLQIHTGVKMFTCDICLKKFSQKSHLNVHIQAHAGKKLFSCHICSKKFLQKSNLNSHILTHTGEKPFNCDLCPKKYSRKSDLNVHKRTHIGYKPFSCDICTKKFAQKSHLKSHIRTHTV